MNSSVPVRKRDRLLAILRKPANQLASPSVVPQPGVPAAPSTASPQTNDPFLQAALQGLTERERLTVREHVASDISATIQAAYDAAEDKKSACEQKRWPGSDKADKILRWLDRFKPIGNVVANVDPVHVGLPWAGIRILLEVAVADSRQMSALVSGMDLALCMANRLQAYFTYYRRLPPVLTTDNLRKELISLYTHVLRFIARAIQVYSMNAAVRMARALWSESDLTNFENDCDKLAGRANIEADGCDRELRAKQWAETAQWKDDLAATLQQLDSIQFIRTSLNVLQVKVDLSKLFKVHEAIYNSTVEGKLSRCLEGTRLQILHAIAQWAEAPEAPDGKSVFWLCGQAGTGKSTISRTVARDLDDKGFLGASFFFKRGEQDRSNANHFFTTITAQLTDVIPQLQAPVAAALDRDSFLCGRSMQVQFEKLLLEPLISIEPHLSRKRVVVVIDALDECDRDTDIQLFLRLLTHIKARSALPLRIFLTSRPELPIRLGFQLLDRSLHEDVVLEEIQEVTIHDNIRTYLDYEFANIRRNQSLIRPADPLPKSWPSKQKMQALVSLAVPLFIFATTACRFISESDPRENLEVILQQQYSAESSQMAMLYLPILNQLLVGKNEEKQHEILAKFREVVGPIVLAADPLSVSSLASILSLSRADVDRRLERLHSVLQVPENSHNPVRLLHLSFRDFLIDPKRKDQSEFWVSKVDTHKRLARDCLRRLDEFKTLRSDICCVVQPGTRRTDCSTQHITTCIPPDVAYACSYWPLHFVGSGERLLDDGLIHRFLQQHFLHWLEALSWLGKLSSVIAYINDLFLIAQDNSSAKISRFLQDAKQFVLQNRHVIDLAPLQTYHSAMIFAPEQSVVRQTFDKQVSKLWGCLPKVPKKWSAEMQKLEGHDNLVNAVAFSPDGQVIASASHDKTVRLWNAATGEQTQKLEGHDSLVNAVAFSPDGQVIASASDDKTVRLWNAATGEQTQKLEGHDNWVNAVAFSPDGQVIASASYDKTVRLWNAATGEQTQKLEGHDRTVNAVAFSPDGQVIASASYDKTVRLWNAATGEMMQLIPNVNTVFTIAFSAEGKCLQTDAGTFLLESSVSGLPADTSARTTSLELRDHWVRNQDEDLLWLPYEYRGSCSAIREQTLVIGQSSGAISIFSLR